MSYRKERRERKEMGLMGPIGPMRPMKAGGVAIYVGGAEAPYDAKRRLKTGGIL
jgi:hypothetical protein